jgi:hypothetical protein
LRPRPFLRPPRLSITDARPAIQRGPFAPLPDFYDTGGGDCPSAIVSSCSQKESASKQTPKCQF